MARQCRSPVEAAYAQESPDGRYLYYSTGNHNTAILRVEPNGEDEVQVVSPLSDWSKFAVTSRGIYYVPDSPSSAIMFLGLGSSPKPRRAASFTAEPILNFIEMRRETELLISMREVENKELRVIDLTH